MYGYICNDINKFWESFGWKIDIGFLGGMNVAEKFVGNFFDGVLA